LNGRTKNEKSVLNDKMRYLQGKVREHQGQIMCKPYPSL